MHRNWEPAQLNVDQLTAKVNYNQFWTFRKPCDFKVLIWCFFTWLIDALAVSQLGQLFAWLHRHWERRCNRLGHCSRLQKDVYATLSSWWQGDNQLFNIFLLTWLIVVLFTESTQGVFTTTTNAAAPHFVQVNNHYFHLLKWTCFKLHIFFFCSCSRSISEVPTGAEAGAEEFEWRVVAATPMSEKSIMALTFINGRMTTLSVLQRLNNTVTGFR